MWLNTNFQFKAFGCFIHFSFVLLVTVAGLSTIKHHRPIPMCILPAESLIFPYLTFSIWFSVFMCTPFTISRVLTMCQPNKFPVFIQRGVFSTYFSIAIQCSFWFKFRTIILVNVIVHNGIAQVRNPKIFNIPFLQFTILVFLAMFIVYFCFLKCLVLLVSRFRARS